MRRPHALHATALLVDQHGRIFAIHDFAKFASQLNQLVRIFDIPLEENESPGIEAAHEVAFFMCQLKTGAASDESADGGIISSSG